MQLLKEYGYSKSSGENSTVSMIITGLLNGLGEDCTRLSPKAIQSAMFGVFGYLDCMTEHSSELSVL